MIWDLLQQEAIQQNAEALKELITALEQRFQRVEDRVAALSRRCDILSDLLADVTGLKPAAFEKVMAQRAKQLPMRRLPQSPTLPGTDPASPSALHPRLQLRDCPHCGQKLSRTRRRCSACGNPC